MEFRSTNTVGFVHFGGDVASGVNSSLGAMLSSNTVQPIGDATDIDLEVKGKGAGVVYLNGSTTPWKVVAGESTYTPPPLAASAQGECTFAAAGISTGDIILQVDLRNGLSTAYLPGLPYVGAADKIHVPVGNVHASTISGSTSLIARWIYLDRTT